MPKATVGPWPPKVREEMHPEPQAEADAEAEGAPENECRTEFKIAGAEHQIIGMIMIPRSN
jgi:hypothetical protein